MVNQKHNTPQNQWGKMMNSELLKHFHKKLNLSAKYFFKMINYSLDPKALCFCRDIILNLTNTIKSYFSENSCKDIQKIEAIFPLEIKVSYPDVGRCITEHAHNQTFDQ